MTFLQDSVIILASQLFFFAGGIVFFVKQLFKNYEIRLIRVQLIFSITFALSLTLFELIIFEILVFIFHVTSGLLLIIVFIFLRVFWIQIQEDFSGDCH